MLDRTVLNRHRKRRLAVQTLDRRPIGVLKPQRRPSRRLRVVLCWRGRLQVSHGEPLFAMATAAGARRDLRIAKRNPSTKHSAMVTTIAADESVAAEPRHVCHNTMRNG